MTMNKKGIEMTIGTIIIIILALVLLVYLLYWFSTGGGNLWQRILGYGGGKVNVQAIVDSCKIACSTSSIYDYCTKEREVYTNQTQKTPDKKKCFELVGPTYGLDTCESISCPATGASGTPVS